MADLSTWAARSEVFDNFAQVARKDRTPAQKFREPVCPQNISGYDFICDFFSVFHDSDAKPPSVVAKYVVLKTHIRQFKITYVFFQGSLPLLVNLGHIFDLIFYMIIHKERIIKPPGRVFMTKLTNPYMFP